jgi:hypothetical protein
VLRGGAARALGGVQPVCLTAGRNMGVGYADRSNVGDWHQAAIPACPRNVRCCAKTGSDLLVVSLTADDA